MIQYVAKSWKGILLIILLTLSGCAVRSTPKVNYYVLLSADQLEQVQNIGAYPEINLGIGPISVPESLKRTQIATRQHGNQFAFNEFNRWAGVLEKDLEAVIGDNIGLLLGIKQVDHFPWRPHFKPNYRVMADIQRLDGDLGGEVVLEVRWRLSDADGKVDLAGTRSVYRRQVSEPGYAGLVKAESQLVADFSKAVAKELDRLLKTTKP